MIGCANACLLNKRYFERQSYGNSSKITVDVNRRVKFQVCKGKFLTGQLDESYHGLSSIMEDTERLLG